MACLPLRLFEFTEKLFSRFGNINLLVRSPIYLRQRLHYLLPRIFGLGSLVLVKVRNQLALGFSKVLVVINPQGFLQFFNAPLMLIENTCGLASIPQHNDFLFLVYVCIALDGFKMPWYIIGSSSLQDIPRSV
jgi:hypothetical protein